MEFNIKSIQTEVNQVDVLLDGNLGRLKAEHGRGALACVHIVLFHYNRPFAVLRSIFEFHTCKKYPKQVAPYWNGVFCVY